MSTQPATESEWKARRLDGIGASETSAILGLSNFASPWSVWRRKVQRTVDEANTDLQEMKDAGHRHEPSMREWFARQADVDASVRKECGVAKWGLVDLGEYHMDWSSETPYLFCTTDAAILSRDAINDGSRIATMEIKCAWFKVARGWEERVPLGNQAQCQHQMYCTELDRAYFAVELDGYRTKWFMIKRNDNFIKRMLAKLDRFWGYVKDGVPPPADFSPATGRAISDYYDTSNGKMIDLPQDAVKWADWWRQAKIDEKDAVRRKDGAANRIKAAIGENEIGVLPQGDIGFSWKPNKKKQRTLRECKIKQETT